MMSPCVVCKDKLNTEGEGIRNLPLKLGSHLMVDLANSHTLSKETKKIFPAAMLK